MEAADRDLAQGKLLYGITEMDETEARWLVIESALREWIQTELAMRKPNPEKKAA